VASNPFTHFFHRSEEQGKSALDIHKMRMRRHVAEILTFYLDRLYAFLRNRAIRSNSRARILRRGDSAEEASHQDGMYNRDAQLR
jgi:hypothetical protein